jgi:hypothetical protein
VASNGAGQGTSPDLTFTTLEAPKVSIVHPHPSIAGVPAVGLRLHCLPGVPTATDATLHYSWIRDAHRISGATGSSYLVKDSDAKHHLQCTVTATNAAGGATASSAFVAIPAQGIVVAAGESAVGRAFPRGFAVVVPLTCAAHSAGSCQMSMRLTSVETLRGNKLVALSSRKSHRPRLRQRTITLASATVTLAPAAHTEYLLTLGSAGRQLLHHSHRLPARLAIAGTVIGSLQASLGTQRLTLSSTAHGARRADLRR